MVSAVLTPLSVVLLAWMNRRDANKAAVKVEEVAVAAAGNTAQLDHIAETTTIIHALVNSDMTKALKGQLVALQAQRALLRKGPDIDAKLITSVETQIVELELALAQRAQGAQDVEDEMEEDV